MEKATSLLSKAMSRRNFGLFAASVAATPLPSAAFAASQSPTDEELTRYYTFLWHELLNLSEEMGVGMLNSYTTIRNDDNRIVSANLDKAPSRRARQMLKAVGLETDQYPSNQRYPKVPDSNW